MYYLHDTVFLSQQLDFRFFSVRLFLHSFFVSIQFSCFTSFPLRSQYAETGGCFSDLIVHCSFIIRDIILKVSVHEWDTTFICLIRTVQRTTRFPRTDRIYYIHACRRVLNTTYISFEIIAWHQQRRALRHTHTLREHETNALVWNSSILLIPLAKRSLRWSLCCWSEVDISKTTRHTYMDNAFCTTHAPTPDTHCTRSYKTQEVHRLMVNNNKSFSPRLLFRRFIFGSVNVWCDDILRCIAGTMPT